MRDKIISSNKIIGDRVKSLLYGFLGKIAESGGMKSKILEEILSFSFVLSKSRGLSDFRRRWKAVSMTRQIFDMNSSLIKIAVLGTADELGIIELLKDGEKSAEEISQNISLDRERTETLLDALSKYEFLIKSDGKYKIAPEFIKVLRRWEPEVKLIWSELKAFQELPKVVKEGKPSSTLDIYNENGDYETLLFGVNAFLHTATRELMERYQFQRIKRVMLGSMGISFAKNIIEKFPDAEIYIGCYPHLIERVPKLIEIYKIPEKNIKDIKKHKGNPDEDKWGDEEKGYDIVFLTKKLTLRSLEEFGSKFLGKSYKVLNKGGCAVIWESIMSDDGLKGPTEESVLDLLVSYSGKRWKEKELKEYVMSFGFSKFEVVRCLGGSITFGIAVK